MRLPQRRQTGARRKSAPSFSPIPISPAASRRPGGSPPKSTDEQAAAGLDRLSPDELSKFTDLNDAYRGRFGIPFIMAVKGKSKADILAAFERRLDNDPDAETQTALVEIDRIAALRLADILK